MSDYISKVVSKVYAVVNDKQKVVAEVIEGCGCGFDYLIRIKPEYKFVEDIFVKCLSLCNISLGNTIITKEVIEKSIDNGYPINSMYQNIALIIDEII